VLGPLLGHAGEDRRFLLFGVQGEFTQDAQHVGQGIKGHLDLADGSPDLGFRRVLL
jgi:hypothetical protein